MAKKKEETEVSVKENVNNLPVSYDYGSMSGAGFENQTSADVAIPFLALLQDLSPECKKGERQLDDAEPGMLMNSVTKEIWSGEEGVVVVPCDTDHKYVEWVPRTSGGGFVGSHEFDSEIVAQAKANSVQRGKLKTAAGNDLVETFYLYCLLLSDAEALEPETPIVVSFTSTKIAAYKRIMTRLRTFKGKPPLFAHRLRITSVPDSKKGQEFHNFVVNPVYGDIQKSLIPPTLYGAVHPLLAVGEALKNAVRGGTAKAAHETQAAGGYDTVDEDLPI